MTQILNNMKRKEKKGLFYLIGIAIMVAIMGISCSANATAPADFSETEDFIEVPAPEVKPEQTPTAPVLTITDWGAIQFDGLTFKNENHTVNIVVKKLGGNNSQARFELNGKTYGFGSRVENNPQYNPNTFIFGNINNDISDKGYAEFKESGDLLIWFNNNQSGLITLKLVK